MRVLQTTRRVQARPQAPLQPTRLGHDQVTLMMIFQQGTLAGSLLMSCCSREAAGWRQQLLSRLLLWVMNWSCLRAQRKESTCKQFRIFVFQFILREAAKKCEIWESAPKIKDIPAKKIAKFEKKVRGLMVYIEMQLKFPALFEGLAYLITLCNAG